VTILLDTQVWLWMLTEPDRISDEARAGLEDGTNVLLLSAASTWELSIKAALGKLTLPGPAESVVPDMITSSGVTPFPIRASHTLRAGSLPPHHRDPFDRLLVAQAQLEGVPLMTADRKLGLYDVEVRSA
jgi:PIN domain nuclease of toxin-antitoxin system